MAAAFMLVYGALYFLVLLPYGYLVMDEFSPVRALSFLGLCFLVTLILLRRPALRQRLEESSKYVVERLRK